MRRGRSFVVIVAWAALLALAAVGSVGALPDGKAAPAAATANSVKYTDSTGETAGPDISTVLVTNDNAGLLTFGITFVNRSVIGPTDVVDVDVDTDRTPTTGTPLEGIDYSIELWGGNGGIALLWRYDPASDDWFMAPMNSLTSRWAGTTLTISISSADLGRTSGFRFFVYADANPDDPAAPYDFAPDFGRSLWSYDVALAPSLRITSIDCKPEPGVAGKPLAGKAVVAVMRNGVAEKLAPDAKVTWKATFGAARLKPVSTRVTGNVLTSTWKLPPTVKAKVVRVTLTVTTEGITVTKTHAHRVR